MARYVETGGGSPFAPNAGLEALKDLNQTLSQNILPMIQQYKQMKVQKQPLGEFLGAKDASDLPEGLRALYNTPVGKIGQLQQALGGSLSQMMTRQPGVNLFAGPGGQFSLTQQPGMVQIPGAKAADAVRAMKPTQTRPTGITPQQVQETADMITKSPNPGAVLAQIPGFGQNSLRSQVVAELAHRGKDIGTMGLDYSATKDYLKTVNGPAFQNTIKYLRSVKPNLDKVISLSDGISRTFAKPINRAQLQIMINSGNKEAAAYATAVTETADQIAKILQGGGTGSATSDAKLKQSMELLDKGFTPGQMRTVAMTLGDMLEARENALKTMTVQTLGNQITPKKDPAVRFQELLKSGKSEADAYKALAQEGH